MCKLWKKKKVNNIPFIPFQDFYEKTDAALMSACEQELAQLSLA